MSRRFFLGGKGTDSRWRMRWVEVLVRSPHDAAVHNALVRFDSGEQVVVPTYRSGVGSTLRLESVR